MKEEEEKDYLRFLQQRDNAMLCSSRVTLMAYISSNGSYFYSNYPINILRNVGIRHTRTSHFIVLDTDMWISEGSYDTLLQLPSHLMTADVGIVIPAFFSIDWKLPNLPIEQQILSYVWREGSTVGSETGFLNLSRISGSVWSREPAWNARTSCLHMFHCWLSDDASIIRRVNGWSTWRKIRWDPITHIPVGRIDIKNRICYFVGMILLLSSMKFWWIMDTTRSLLLKISDFTVCFV